MKRAICILKVVLFSSLLGLALLACEATTYHGLMDDDDPDADTDTETAVDTDIDTDTDADSGTDTDTDTGDTVVASSYLWVANTAEGTLSKVDTKDAVEVARYKTCELADNGGFCDPSRTSVNLHGDMVVTNRSPGDNIYSNYVASTVVKFAADEEDCVDRNSNGVIDTSTGPTDVRPWGEDECMVWSTELPTEDMTSMMGHGARATAWDGKEDEETGEGGRVFVGTCDGGYGGQQTVYMIWGDTGEIMGSTKINSNCAYGGAMGPDGGFWIMSGYGSAEALVRVDTNTFAVSTHTLSCGYGISVDSSGRIWAGGMGMMANCVSRFDPETNQEEIVNIPGAEFLRGIAVGVEKSIGYVWAADTSGRLYQIREEPVGLFGEYSVGAGGMIGVAVDYEGYVWTVDQMANTTYKFDPETGTAISVPIGQGPYTYSDMTGVQLSNAVGPI